jgi:hypothetical protein
VWSCSARGLKPGIWTAESKPKNLYCLHMRDNELRSPCAAVTCQCCSEGLRIPKRVSSLPLPLECGFYLHMPRFTGNRTAACSVPAEYRTSHHRASYIMPHDHRHPSWLLVSSPCCSRRQRPPFFPPSPAALRARSGQQLRAPTAPHPDGCCLRPHLRFEVLYMFCFSTSATTHVVCTNQCPPRPARYRAVAAPSLPPLLPLPPVAG